MFMFMCLHVCAARCVCVWECILTKHSAKNNMHSLHSVYKQGYDTVHRDCIILYTWANHDICCWNEYFFFWYGCEPNSRLLFNYMILLFHFPWVDFIMLSNSLFHLPLNFRMYTKCFKSHKVKRIYVYFYLCINIFSVSI